MMPTSHGSLSPTRAREIERCVRRLQGELWKEQLRLDPSTSDELSVLRPGVALERLGYDVQTVDCLGESTLQGKRVRIAGLLDRNDQIVRLSRQFPEPELLYTASHELAHVVLGHQGEMIHRDRPMDPSTWQKDPKEREADYFAACFRMPEKSVRRYFEEIFLTEHFVLTEATAFALFYTSCDVEATRIRSERDLSLTLARATSYGRPVQSLIEIFNVTPSAMARRLEELRLLTAPVRR